MNCANPLKLYLFLAALIVTLTACGGGAEDKSTVQNLSTPSSVLRSSSPSSTSNSSPTLNKLDLTPPSTPANFRVVSATPEIATINWTQSSDDVGVIFYRIYRDQVLIDTIFYAYTTYYDVSIVPGQTYVYGVAAGDTSGNWSELTTVIAKIPNPGQAFSSLGTSASSTGSNTSAKSSSKSSLLSSSAKSSSSAPVEIDVTAPTMPDQLYTRAIFSTQVDLMWTTSTDNVAVAGYKIYRDSNPVPLAQVNSNTFSYTDSTVMPNKTYVYGVSAGDLAGNWSTQKNLTVQTLPASPPQGGFTLRWLPPTERENGLMLGASEIGGYIIRYKATRETKYTYTSASSNVDQLNINLSGDYIFEIATVDTDGVYSRFVSIRPM